MNWDKLYTDAYKHFDCGYLPPSICCDRGIDDRQLRKRHEKKQRIGETLNHFRSLMNSTNPPRTKQEAVKALSPLMGYLLWSIFKFFVVKVIEWAWNEYETEHGKNQQC